MAAGGAAAAAIVEAIKASGVLVCLDPAEFLKIVGRVPNPLVVSATGGFFSKHYRYLTGYKGLAFYTKSSEPLRLPAGAEVVAANRMWMPG
jgi:hypothetical protein